MPSGIPITEVIFCLSCGKQLTSKQITASRAAGRNPKYCSYNCSKKNYNPNSVKEPETYEEERKFYQAIEEGKKIVPRRVEDNELIQSLTPSDDSPEAERKFREAICPEDQYFYSDTGYSTDPRRY